MSTRRWKRGGRLGIAGDDVDRRHDHEENARLGEHPADNPSPAEMLGLGLAGDHTVADQRMTSMTATIAAAINAPTITPSRLAMSQADDALRGPDRVSMAWRSWQRLWRRMRRGDQADGGGLDAAGACALPPRNFRSPTSSDESHLRARGRCIPFNGLRGLSRSASISLGWT